MAEGGEMRGFVFAVVFMIVFSALLSSVPTGLQGPEEALENITPVDPALLTDFTSYENWNRSDCTPPLYQLYEYTLDGRDWIFTETGFFTLGAKQYLWIFWLGGMDQVKFIASTGADRGNTLEFDEIAEDASNGSIRYSLIYETDGNSAGGFIVYWNTSLYSDPEDAWDNNKLVLIHGVGIDTGSGENILGILFALLLLQLPEVPVLVNLLLATPVWACIIYIIWFLIVNMIPFLGGG